MSGGDQFEYSEKRTVLSRWGFALGVCAVGAIGVFLIRQVFSSAGGTHATKPPELVAIKPFLPPPPPPPPPPTPPPPEPKQEMMTQAPLNEQDQKPDDKPPAPSPALGTNVQGNGPPDGFGLGRSGSGGLGGGGSGGGRGSQFGWYAREVVGAFGDALRANSLTRDAVFNIRVRIWLDQSGHVTRVHLADSTGNPNVDAALRDQILVSVRLPDPPPDGMPMPIVARLTATRPN